MYLEIVDQPLDSFNNNIAMLTNNILRLEPNYSNTQTDLNYDDSKYIFSLQGNAVLKTQNQERMNFIMSFRVFINVSSGSNIREQGARMEDVVSVDFIKIKIFN